MVEAGTVERDTRPRLFMNRRNFFRAITGAALAVNLELRSLVPVLDFAPKLPYFYLIEETVPLRTNPGFMPHVLKHVRWIDEKEMLALGLKHEDFAERTPDWRYNS